MSVCDVDGCDNAGLFRTRTRPTWCRNHIGTPFREVGLELLVPFTTKNASYATRCLTCGTENDYRFSNVLTYRDRGAHLCNGCLLVDQSKVIHQYSVDGVLYKHVQESALPILAKLAGYDFLEAMDEERPLLNISPLKLRCTHCGRVVAKTVDMLFEEREHQCNPAPTDLVPRQLDHDSPVTLSSQRSRNPKSASVGTDYARKANFFRNSDHAAMEWWDQERNTEADWKNAKTKGRKKYHWVCPEGHRFTEIIIDMTRWGPSCPECTKLRQEQADRKRREREGRYAGLMISDVPELATAWNDAAAAEATPVFDPEHRHRTYDFLCPEGHRWRTDPFRFLDGTCSQCRGLETRRRNKEKAKADPTRSRLTPEITSQWHPTRNLPLTIAEVSPESRKLVWWKDPVCGHEFQATVRERDKYHRLRCPQCQTILDSLAFHYPDVAAEWSERNGNLTPWHVRPTTSQLGTPPYWDCPASPDHVWRAMPASRVQGSTCPMCQEAGTSRIEKVYATAAAVLWPKVEPGQRVFSDKFAKHSSWTVDILVILDDQRKLVIEYDGSYWHRDKFSVDTEKTRDFLAASYLVCRLREQPLDLLEIEHPNLMQIPVSWDADDPSDVMLRIEDWVLGKPL